MHYYKYPYQWGVESEGCEKKLRKLQTGYTKRRGDEGSDDRYSSIIH